MIPEYSSYNNLADELLDCSDIAANFNRNFKGGYILELTPKSGKLLNGIEYGKRAGFTYHQVYVKGTYVYDPMFSSAPIKTIDFLKTYQEMNPAGVKLIKR